MGAMSGLLGTAGGVNGTGMSGPGQAAMQSGVTPEQLSGSYGNYQNSLLFLAATLPP